MNEIIKAMIERRSIRKFKPDAVPGDLLDRIIEAGLYAASARGKQSTAIVAVTNRELRDRLSAMNCAIGGWQPDFDPFYGAPAILIVLARKDWPNRVYDGSLVMGNLMLAAHSLGLGSIWIHRAKEEFESDAGREILRSAGLSGEWEGIGHCAVGYIDGEVPPAAPRLEGRVFYVK
ncbi:MAG: nitroreductase [Lentisphaeria bacterium]|nr:nitroreductase [Lentisphaeria bacterium]